MLTNCGNAYIYTETPRRQDVREPIRGELAQPPVHTCFNKGQSGNPRGRPAKYLAALLAAALNEKVTVSENGKRRQITDLRRVICGNCPAATSALIMAVGAEGRNIFGDEPTIDLSLFVKISDLTHHNLFD